MTGTDASTPGSPQTPPEDVRARLSRLRGRLGRLEERLEERLPELLPDRRSRPLWHWYTELRDDERADSDRPWVKVPPIIGRAPLALGDWTASFGRRLRLDRGLDLPPGPESYRRIPESPPGEAAGTVGPGGGEPEVASTDVVDSGTAADRAAGRAAGTATGAVPGAPAAGSRRLVALGLPGIWEDWRHFHVWAQELHDAGWDVHLLESLGDMTAPVPDLAGLVAEHLHFHDLHDVVLFAHSKGGLVGKAVMLGPEGDRVRGLIACATPFNGAPITQLLPTSELSELSPHSPTIAELSAEREVDSRIIQVEAEWDQSVPPSPLPGVRHITLPITGHSAMLSSPEVARTLVVLTRQLVDRGGAVTRGGTGTRVGDGTGRVRLDRAPGQDTDGRPHPGSGPGPGPTDP
ncbi:hypothetical protein [Actinomyces sp.]|uniref:lipase family alpha/beta hydrolase n=1 Tax=Actinomyces sp. TaxID=29317 RepID=UPI00289B283D|nr:hypothetical protein [Actinomyces sp.]